MGRLDLPDVRRDEDDSQDGWFMVYDRRKQKWIDLREDDEDDEQTGSD